MPRAPARIRVNRAPVLTLWAAVVAETLGHDHDTALTLGKALAGLNAQSKGKRLGIYEAPEEEAKTRPRPRARTRGVELMGRRIPVVRTPQGLRAARDGKPESPAAVEHYLESKFGASLSTVRAAMTALATAMPKPALEERAYTLYEEFRPAVPAGERGWGARGVLDVAGLRRLARGA